MLLGLLVVREFIRATEDGAEWRTTLPVFNVLIVVMLVAFGVAAALRLSDLRGPITAANAPSPSSRVTASPPARTPPPEPSPLVTPGPTAVATPTPAPTPAGAAGRVTIAGAFDAYAVEDGGVTGYDRVGRNVPATAWATAPGQYEAHFLSAPESVLTLVRILDGPHAGRYVRPGDPGVTFEPTSP